MTFNVAIDGQPAGTNFAAGINPGNGHRPGGRSAAHAVDLADGQRGAQGAGIGDRGGRLRSGIGPGFRSAEHDLQRSDRRTAGRNQLRGGNQSGERAAGERAIAGGGEPGGDKGGGDGEHQGCGGQCRAGGADVSVRGGGHSKTRRIKPFWGVGRTRHVRSRRTHLAGSRSYRAGGSAWRGSSPARTKVRPPMAAWFRKNVEANASERRPSGTNGWNSCQTCGTTGHRVSSTRTPAARARAASSVESSRRVSSAPT